MVWGDTRVVYLEERTMTRRELSSDRHEASTDIPVIVDAVRTRKDLALVRCNYMSVECDNPQVGWSLGVGGATVPFMMLGMAGIIMGPIGSSRFDSLESIEDIFATVEDEGDLVVDVDDIWLPKFLFEDIGEVPRNGDVYRLESEAFVLAYSFKENRLSVAEYLETCQGLERPLSPSLEEQQAFADWHQSLIDGAIRQYPKNAAYELDWWEETPT